MLEVESAWEETSLVQDLGDVAGRACMAAQNVRNLRRSVSGACGLGWKTLKGLGWECVKSDVVEVEGVVAIGIIVPFGMWGRCR